MMDEDYRYYRISLSAINAIIGVDGDKGAKTIDCSNYQTCLHSSVLEDGKCPRYCMIIVEAKHYDYGRKNTRADVQEMHKSEVLEKARTSFA